MTDFVENGPFTDYSRVRRGRVVRAGWAAPHSAYSSTIVLTQLKNLEMELRDLKSFRKQMPKNKNNEKPRDVLKTLINSMKEEINWRREFLGLEIENGNYP